jgi:hypothetical protein
LKQIFGILPQRDHSVDVTEERFAPGIEQRIERILVAVACSLDERDFFVRWNLR